MQMTDDTLRDLVRRWREKQADMAEAIERLDSGEFDNGIMRVIRLEQHALFKNTADAIEALQQDAARYRWLRGCEYWHSAGVVQVFDDGDYSPAQGAELDAAIDAARAELEKKL